ncbi:MAG: glycosyltransferase family 4 protein [Pseudomonadota bacterium]
MRIGVDARPLCVPTFGIGRYTRAILDRLTNESGHEWFLYADRPFLFSYADRPGVVQRHFEAHNPALSLLRTQWTFARWAVADKLDVFWSPRHHLPILLGRRIPTVLTIHDLVWKRFPHTMLPANRLVERCLMPVSLRKADAIIAVSQATRDEVVNFFPHTIPRISVVPEAADMIAAEPPLPPPPYFLFVGTLEPRKNLLTLMEAFSLALPDLPPRCRLIIVGAEGWNMSLEKIIRAFSVQDRVELLGHVSEGVLHQHLAGAIALCLPSLYEGFGLPALEAMQHGTPVIGANTSSIPEVVGGGGLLVDPLSADDMAAALVQLANNPGERESLSRAALEQAARFSWDRTAANTRRLIEAVVTRS